MVLIELLLLIWGGPAMIALGLTWSELRQRQASLFDRYALGGTAVCLFWPIAVPVLFFLTPEPEGQMLFP